MTVVALLLTAILVGGQAALRRVVAVEARRMGDPWKLKLALHLRTETTLTVK